MIGLAFGTLSISTLELSDHCIVVGVMGCVEATGQGIAVAEVHVQAEFVGDTRDLLAHEPYLFGDHTGVHRDGVAVGIAGRDGAPRARRRAGRQSADEARQVICGLPLFTSAWVLTYPPSNKKLLLMDQPLPKLSLSSEPK